MLTIDTSKIKSNERGSYPTMIFPFHIEKSSLSKIGMGVKVITRYKGYLDKVVQIFAVSKDVHALQDMKVSSDISYDEMMGKLKKSYFDCHNREVFTFDNKKDAETKLNSFANEN